MLNLQIHTEHFTNPLYLESGRILEPYDIVYETYGELNDARDNVIVITHALTGSHHAAGTYEGDNKAGWWDALIGPGKAVDTDRFFVICTNVIGSCFGSTGPMSPRYPYNEPYRYKFPVITILDMVKAQRILFDRLGIHQVHAVIGGSMGGMQALAFGVFFPNFAKKIIAMATTAATQPWAIAFNKVAQEAILKDPDFKNGYYDPEVIRENGLSGMAIGRMAGHISFLSHQSMTKKFGREYRRNDGLFELFGKFQIESYLEYNGYNFTKWFDPLSYLYITKAINIYDLSRGFDSLEEALSKINAELYLVSFEKDLLFLPDEMESIYNAMKSQGKENVDYLAVQSDYGHDAFLVEIDKIDQYVREAL
ncbi:MAG: homoserine acetyltransferase [Sulfuricurvum sp. MLSB]|jgi:homoserine O-acetyltransferase|uniref:homoserine O-acetyltransferase MetX n=1 Tax=unclassified Sulfuricurvum TaxID=2632390 RepID=UPI0004FF64C8|nr:MULTISPECIES: homoserine O-acetyltransferase [unclassified Sulfuricurvum]KFN40152.1 MAG: homoserine acetyltransferase [Sulfuricurvum sp. MLSB]